MMVAEAHDATIPSSGMKLTSIIHDHTTQLYDLKDALLEVLLETNYIRIVRALG